MLEVQNEDVNLGMIRNLSSGLNRVMKKDAAPFSVLDKGNPKFHELLLALNSVTSSLHCLISPRIGPTKNAKVCSEKRSSLGTILQKHFRGPFFPVV